MRAAIIVFPGSNCDHDAYYVMRKVLNKDVDFIWHKEGSLANYDFILVPGGFSYGDYLRAGAIARFSPIMDEVIRCANKGIPVMGICNGFQILIESGLLPGALINNKNVKFLSQNVTLKVASTNSIFTQDLKKGEKLDMPIAHRQGNFFASDDVVKKLQDDDQVAFTYDDNPNGSLGDIAGIFNENRNVLGMMPHPERAAESILGSSDGLAIFESVIENM
ncbi:MAG: phosphoribosylformylglycinamidine synthase subunit PurQ [Candidatus Marinimicrobia bacterium]|nr:phosphoribosylformylglycinamidine synthase subunit PurQ [Candidatus Neomarinimicrobiota bacterium]